MFEEKDDFIGKALKLYKTNPQKFKSILTLVIISLLIIFFISIHIKRKKEEIKNAYIEAGLIYNQELNSDTSYYDRIIGAYKKVVDLNPPKNYLVDAYLTLGDCYSNQKDFEKAIEYYDKAISILKKDDYFYYQALLSKANVYNENNNETTAITIYGEIYNSEKTPQSFKNEAGLNLAYIKEKQNEIEESKNIYKKIYEQNKDNMWQKIALMNIQRIEALNEISNK